MKTLRAWLIFRARDSNLRVVRTDPRRSLDWDEISFAITVQVPQPWGRAAGTIDIVLPDSGPAEIDINPEGIRPSAESE